MSKEGIISQKETLIETIVEWSINDFLCVPDEVTYNSPLFSFAKESWYLKIYPKAEKWDNRDETERFIKLYLYRDSFGPKMKVEITFGVKTVNGNIDYVRRFLCETRSIQRDFSVTCNDFLSRSDLQKRSDLLPSNTLTLVCIMKRKGINEVTSSNNLVSTKCIYCNKTLSAQEDIECHLRQCEELPIKCQKCSGYVALKNWYAHKCQMADSEGSSKKVTTKCSYCSRTLDTEEDIQSHLQECEDLPLKCRKCNDGVALKNWYEHKCQMTNAEDEGVLCQDFKKMLSNGQNHDLTLKVGDKELRAHQDVLKARCPVFESMLNHDTAEKKSGIVDIPDCNPQAMELFLLYVYCGKVETLDETNMLGLYYTADKYDMQSLKQKCCGFIKHSLSHTNICEVIQLALTHNNTSLLEYATEYFMDNTVDIMLTVEWQNFMKDNATAANELMLKSIRKVNDSKN